MVFNTHRSGFTSREFLRPGRPGHPLLLETVDVSMFNCNQTHRCLWYGHYHALEAREWQHMTTTTLAKCVEWCLNILPLQQKRPTISVRTSARQFANRYQQVPSTNSPQHTIKSEQYTVHVHDCYQLTRFAAKAYCTLANSSDDGLPNSLCSEMISTTLFAAAGSDRASTQISATCSSTHHNLACLTKQSHCASWVVADLICSTSLETTLISGPPEEMWHSTWHFDTACSELQKPNRSCVASYQKGTYLCKMCISHLQWDSTGSMTWLSRSTHIALHWLLMAHTSF